MRVTGLTVCLLLFLAALMGCLEPENEEGFEIDIPQEATQVVMPPGGEFFIRNDTAIITAHDTSPMVHSFPRYAGVPDAGDIGLGSAIGYSRGMRVTIPCNANLGGKKLASYEVRLTIEKPNTISLVSVEGSNPTLSQYYPSQYKRAGDFEFTPDVLDGATPGVLYVSTQPVQQAATGRINLFNLLIDLDRATPVGGTNIFFELVSFKNPSNNDACPAAGCTLFDSIFIKEFELQ